MQSKFSLQLPATNTLLLQRKNPKWLSPLELERGLAHLDQGLLLLLGSALVLVQGRVVGVVLFHPRALALVPGRIRLHGRVRGQDLFQGHLDGDALTAPGVEEVEVAAEA